MRNVPLVYAYVLLGTTILANGRIVVISSSHFDRLQ